MKIGTEKPPLLSGRHPIKVEYPTSLEMANAGLADAGRTIYPDEMKKAGFHLVASHED